MPDHSSSTDIPVLIVGAGPTGLTLACDLARRGVAFRIVDKADAYFTGSRGKGLQPRSLEVLDDLGVVDRIVQNGRFHLPFRAYDGKTVLGDRDLSEGSNPTPSTPYASSLIIPQFRVEETLRQLLESYERRVELAAEVVAVENGESGVDATLRTKSGTERIRCKYLIACDGGRSFVRKHLNFAFAGATWTEAKMYIGDVEVDILDRDHWHTWPKHPDGWFALCPLPSTSLFQLQASIPGDATEQPSLEIYQRIAQERTGWPELRLSNPTWLSLYTVNVRMVDRYRSGGVFLAGDAAHIHSPAGGQGMNTGIQDAYNLGWKLQLALETGNDSLLSSYEEERLPVAADVLELSSQLGLQFRASGNQMQRSSQTSQLGINYRGSSLCASDAAKDGPLEAGDRAPDGPLEDSSGAALRLFDLFRGPKFTLLQIGASDDTLVNELSARFSKHVQGFSIVTSISPAVNTSLKLHDKLGSVTETYGAKSPLLVLVRPDGYIGHIGPIDQNHRAEAYLKRILA
jgi:2-polyprenyl-6-methoxyphenol hydroxylase-like FAD-dependent oxidoreductase